MAIGFGNGGLQNDLARALVGQPTPSRRGRGAISRVPGEMRDIGRSFGPNYPVNGQLNLPGLPAPGEFSGYVPDPIDDVARYMAQQAAQGEVQRRQSPQPRKGVFRLDPEATGYVLDAPAGDPMAAATARAGQVQLGLNLPAPASAGAGELLNAPALSGGAEALAREAQNEASAVLGRLPEGSPLAVFDRSGRPLAGPEVAVPVRTLGSSNLTAIGAGPSNVIRGSGITELVPGSRLARRAAFEANSGGFDPRNAPDRGIASLLTGVNAAGEPVETGVLVDPAMRRGDALHPQAFLLNREDFPAVKGQAAATPGAWPVEWEAYKEYLGGLAQEADLLNERLRDDPKFAAAALSGDPAEGRGATGGSADRTDHFRVPVEARDRSGQWRGALVDPSEVIATVDADLDSPYNSERFQELTRAQVYADALRDTQTPVIGEQALLAAEAAGRFKRVPASEGNGSLVGYLQVAGKTDPEPVYAPKDLQLRRDVPDPANRFGGVVSELQRGYRIGSPVNRDASALAARLREEDPALVTAQRIPGAPVLGLGALQANAAQHGVRYFDQKGQEISPASFTPEGLLTGEDFDPMKPITAVRADGSQTRLLPRWNEQTGLGYIVEDSLNTVNSGAGPLLAETALRQAHERRGGLSTGDFAREVAAGRFSVEPPQRDVMGDLAAMLSQEGVDPSLLTNRLAHAAGDPTMVAAARLRGALEDHRSRTGQGVPPAVAVAWAEDLARQGFSPSRGPVDPLKVFSAAAAMGEQGATRQLFAEGSHAARTLQQGMREKQGGREVNLFPEPATQGSTGVGGKARARAAELLDELGGPGSERVQRLFEVLANPGTPEAEAMRNQVAARLQSQGADATAIGDELEALGRAGQGRYGNFGAAPEDQEVIYGGGFGIKREPTSADMASEKEATLQGLAKSLLQPGAYKSDAQAAYMADLAARVAVQSGRPAEQVLAEIMNPPVAQIRVPSRDTIVNRDPGLGGYEGEPLNPKNRQNVAAQQAGLETWKREAERTGRPVRGVAPARQAVRSQYQQPFDLGIGESGARKVVPYSSVAANLSAEVGSPEQEAAMALLADRLRSGSSAVTPDLAERTRNFLLRRAQAARGA